LCPLPGPAVQGRFRPDPVREPPCEEVVDTIDDVTDEISLRVDILLPDILLSGLDIGELPERRP
jgi:hypothetical protein